MNDAQLQALRGEYTRFLRSDRILLTGHSHQAWPDAVRDALVRCFDDAAEWVDDKWDRVVFPKLTTVTRAVASRMGFAADDPVAIGRSTHELAFRLLSCLDLGARPRIVTTTGEFHSLHRQLRRLEEQGAVVVWVDANDRGALADALLSALVPGTALCALSAVLFEDAYVVPRLGEIVARAVEVGAIPLVDAYHAYNVVPVWWGPCRDQVYALAGGYKYAQFGEGLCWMRFPKDCALRPVYTGWFADFGALAGPRDGRVSYGEGGARFAGSTFDPVGLYRAEAALEVFDRHGLSVPVLRARSRDQTRRIVEGLRAGGAEVCSSADDDRRGGFVSLRSERAGEVTARLRERGVYVDSRGDLVRLGPAPYLTDDELDRGIAQVLEVLRG